MNKSIFDFQAYRSYLTSFIKSQPGGGRGFRARMAEAIGCQKGFISKVLDSESGSEFSLEQGDRLNALLHHTEEESNYFLLMIQLARAGTPSLREHFRNQMKVVINRRLELRKDLRSRTVLSPEDQMRYYSHWYYAALGVAVSIPTLQTKEALAKALEIPLDVTTSALEFLVSRGFILQQGDHFRHPDQQQVHLPSSHALIGRHHTNWRLQALKSLDKERPQDLHYSYVVTMSQQDALQIRSYLVEAIKEVLARAAPSKEETLYSFCMDYFEVASKS